MDNPDQLHTKETGETEHLPFEEGWERKHQKTLQFSIIKSDSNMSKLLCFLFPTTMLRNVLKHFYFIMESFNCISNPQYMGNDFK